MRVTHDYAIDNQVYVEITGIYCKFDYNKHVPYIINGVYTHFTVQVQQGQVNELINIIWLKPHLN